MKLSHGRYLLTATIRRNLMGLGLPVGTRVTAAVVFSASGVHSYRLTKIAPNPKGYELDEDDFMYEGWEDGHAALVKELLGHKVDIVVTAHPGGGMELSAIHADTSVPLFNASGAWRRAKDQSNLGEPVAPNVPAGPVKPHNGPILYLPATCGWFNGGESLTEIVRWLATYRGRVGLNFEATGSTGNHGVRTKDCLGVYADHCARLAGIVIACSRAGVPVKIDAINSNDFGKGWSASWKDTPGNRIAVLSIMRGMADNLLNVDQWCIVQPVSEDDSSMPAKLRTDCWGAWKAAGWPDSRICGRGIAETHTGELKALKAPALASTDNGPAIEKHFGRGVWTAHTPNVQRCGEYARHYLSRGVHVSLYHRADRLHLLEHRAAYDQIIKAAGILSATGGGSDSPVAPVGPSPTTPGAAYLKFSAGSHRRYVKWSPAVDRSKWGRNTGIKGQPDGLIYGRRKGEKTWHKVEWILPGKQETGLKNAYDDVNDPKYDLGWKSGEVVELQQRDAFGKVKDASLWGEWVLA